MAVVLIIGTLAAAADFSSFTGVVNNMSGWNPWHGCTKISEGCRNCYVYRADAKYDRQSAQLTKTQSFGLPLKKARGGGYKLQPDGGPVYTCFTSDFFHEGADEWRQEAWRMMKLRSDLQFLFITKRIHRFYDCIPPDWGSGYENVAICCTCENQDRADFRLPIFLEAPIRRKFIVCEPLLERIDISRYLTPEILSVWAGGESGEKARLCDYEWILYLRGQCLAAGIGFHFHQTGALLRKGDRIYRIPRRLQHSQAHRAGINIADRSGLFL